MCAIYDAKEKLWTNPEPRSFTDLKITHGQLILDVLSTHGSKVAQINADNGNQMTFHEMRLETIRIAQNLQKRGFKSHKVFSFIAVNSDHLVPVLLASICLACPIAPLHPMLSTEEIVRIWMKTKPSVVFCDVSAYDKMNEALKELNWDVKVFTFGGQIDGVEPVENLLIETGTENDFEPVKYNIEKDIAFINCSSGTTGPSKSVCVSYSATLFEPDIDVFEDSVIFSDEIIYWSIGVKPIINSIHTGAKRIITTRPFSPQFLLNLIEQYKINILYVATFSLILCLKNEMIDKTDLSSVKTLIFYGSKFPSSLSLKLKRYFFNAKECVSVYGMTEIGRIGMSYIDANGNRSGEKMYNGRQAKIVDENGNRCGPGINGELCMKLTGEFLGYLDDPKANAEAIDDEGFFHTGDVVHFDDNGIIFIEDRKKNVIDVFYFDSVILPSEIEDFLVSVLDIKEVCVVGVQVASGEALPAAVIVLKPTSKLTARDVYNLVAEKFPNRSRLRGGVYFVDSLEKNLNGKLMRKKVTETATELFRTAKDNDPDIQSYLQDIPDEFRKLI